MNTALDQLTIKQIKFCEEYIRHDGNATNAYISAYKAKNRYSAAKCGSQLLKKQPIKEYVKVLMHDAGLNDIVADK
jgi:phage terminase small subunit